MTRPDWLALSILAVFCVAGSFSPWFRRTRVALLVVLFLGLQLYPWLAASEKEDFIMPFASYRLYPDPPPPIIRYPELRMVTASGADYEIDFRVWQPHIARYFNVLLGPKLGQALDPAVKEFFLARVR